jgi:hypothetical protein
MEAKDFRVGNLVSFNINHNETGVVSEILKNQIGINHRLDIRYHIENLKPIPITNQWKEKLKNTPIYTDETGFVVFKNSYSYAFIWEDYPFLHQLQNLYFCLTGQELTI